VRPAHGQALAHRIHDDVTEAIGDANVRGAHGRQRKVRPPLRRHFEAVKEVVQIDFGGVQRPRRVGRERGRQVGSGQLHRYRITEQHIDGPCVHDEAQFTAVLRDAKDAGDGLRLRREVDHADGAHPAHECGPFVRGAAQAGARRALAVGDRQQ